jgi:sterol desaturase/sphingolipid hydroxylase (fatty acid hydroxylase superfamily)
MLKILETHFAHLHGAVFQAVVQPVLYHCGWMAYAESAFEGLHTMLLGICEIALLYLCLPPLEAVRPVETWPHRRDVRVDVFYTWLHRLGILPLLIYALLSPLEDTRDGWLHRYGLIASPLEDWLPVLPRGGLMTFLVYLVIHDCVAYWIHRAQHAYAWWWALHSLHHSQRQLSFWADNRNHMLDDVLRAVVLAIVARVIGVPPGQFVTLTVLTQAVESLAHANVRLSFGILGERVLVSPRFHRLHHAMGVGHEGPAQEWNFAVLLPLWDIVWRTASFHNIFLQTGVRDQLAGHKYGRGFWQQQWLGLQRLAATWTRRPGFHTHHPERRHTT